VVHLPFRTGFAAGGILLAAVALAPATAAVGAAPSRHSASIAANLVVSAWDGIPVGQIDRHVFQMALSAAGCAARKGHVANPSTLTVIDYSRASTTKRLWVYDLQSRRLLYEELVAHGQGSGGNFATSFSNRPDTHQSSIGLFVTDESYTGKNGYSLRLDGLEPGFNDQARARAIVMHGAPYVDATVARAQGRLGRSWGCPAVREAVARDLIDRVRSGGLVFAYYPDADWLQSSQYLNACGFSS
jgi:hypothetical protein